MVNHRTVADHPTRDYFRFHPDVRNTMTKNHEGECVDVDPYIPTGICALCEATETEPTE